MPRPKLRPALVADRLLAALVWIWLLVASCGSVAVAEPLSPGALPPQAELQLEVWINGHTTNLIAPFVELPGGLLAMASGAFDDLDLSVSKAAAANGYVPLDGLRGITYAYNRTTQVVELTVPQSLRRPKVYSAGREGARIEPARSDYGSVLNYTLFGSAVQGASTRATTNGFGGFNGVNANLDGRLLTPFGIFDQSGLVGSIPSGYTSHTRVADVTDAKALRYESAFTHLDPANFLSYRAGDTINGSLFWTQPIRMAGLQVQRNFAARPDIVTQALPSFTGSAAAPSSVDLFVNGIKTYSQQVGAGPFQLSNVPVIGGGEARLVVRDASGREVETKLPFYSAPTLLRPGLFEASAEAGFARYNYGITSSDYGSSPVASASLRTGLMDGLTGELHGEGGLGLVNGGLGLVASVFDRAILGGAVSASVDKDRTGLQLYGSLDTQVGVVNIHAQTSRSLGRYADLASVSRRLRPTTADEEARAAYHSGVTSFYGDYRPAISRDQITVGLPLAFDHSSISASFVRTDPEIGTPSQIVSLTYSRPFIARSTLFATAFANLDHVSNVGAYVGVSMTLGDASVATSFSHNNTSTTAGVDVAKPLGYEPGSWGYRVRDNEGSVSTRAGAISYRSEKARFEATVQQDGTSVRETLEASGSLVAMGGGVYLANTIDDGFAVVNAGAPGVRVLSENRFVGETDASGMLLVPGLRSHVRNTLAIDPTNLSISAEVDEPQLQVVPALRGGVNVDFKVRREGSSAVVILKRPDGSFVEAGSNGKLEAGGETFIVGYDGQAFIKNLAAHNTAAITLGKNACRASFAFVPKADTQVVVGPIVCE